MRIFDSSKGETDIGIYINFNGGTTQNIYYFATYSSQLLPIAFGQEKTEVTT